MITKNNKTVIIDTKWKIIDDNRPGDDDLKQMFVYNLLWDAEKSVLLYPGNKQSSSGSYLHFHLSKKINVVNEAETKEGKKSDYYNHCWLCFFDIVDINTQASKERFANFLIAL